MQQTQIHYTKVREYIWQIEDKGVYCTLIKGKKLAILWDTGYGEQDLKGFVESHCETPYIVINSHGHPDHCLGDGAFEEVYANPAEWDVIIHYMIEELEDARIPKLKEVTAGEVFDLGGVHAKVISMEGHTKGSIGLLIEEEELLLSGDAINGNLWMFNYGASPLRDLYGMLKRLDKLPFKTALCGHGDRELDKNIIYAHMRNLEHLQVNEESKRYLFGIETYVSEYEGEEGRSEITYSKDLL